MVLSVENNNPGNIRDVGIAWEGRTGSNSGFVTFATPELGVRALTRNLYTYQNRGLTSVRDMISTWAPPSENDTTGYVNFVAGQMGVDPDAPVNLSNNPALTQQMVGAMIQMEGGSAASAYFSPHIASGVGLANGTTDPSGASVPTTEVRAGDIGPDGEPLTAAQAEDIREAAAEMAEQRPSGRRGESLYLDNILNQYESYTYNWAIHMAHPLEIHEGESLIEKNRVVTLAETGVENEITIDRVTQELALTFTEENRNSVANMFKIDFIEPGGMTFFTRIFNAAQTLGIENHLQAVYILELNFRGWKEGNVADPEIIGPYYYFCTMSQLQMDYKDGASIYYGNLVETHQEAYRRLDFHLTADMDFTAGTFGQFLTEFQTRVNEQALEQAKNGRGQVLPNEYVFNTTDDASDWESWQFDALSADRQVSYSGISVSGDGTLRFSMAAGTAITSAIALAIYQTTNFKRLLTESGFAKDNPDDGEARPERLAEIVRWVKFNTDVKYLEYDYILRHYQREITYTVGPYITPEAVHDPSSYLRLVRDSNLQNERLRNIFDNGLLRKRFDYTHTGLNTEVLDLDLKLNNTFYQIQALNSGALNHREMMFNGSAGQEQFEIAALRSDRDSIRQRIDAIDQQIESGNDRIAQINTELSGEENLRREAVRVEQTRISELQADRRELQPQFDRASVAYDNAYNDFVTQSRENRRDTTLQSLQTRYLTQSDLYSTPDVTDILPMTFRYGPVNSLATAGPDKGVNDVGSVMLGAVEMNLNSLGDLVQQSLFVKGDPYWLGRPRGMENDDNQAHYDLGGCQYFFNTMFPSYPDEQSGLMNSLASFSVTGLYRVYKVRAEYGDGKFTMLLTSFRDMNTNVETLYEELLHGNVFDRATSRAAARNTGQNETNNSGDGSPSQGGQGSDAPVTSANGADATPNLTNIDPNINPDLAAIFQQTAAQSGVSVSGTSGVRYAAGVGSGRHAGDAHDIALYSDGRRLSVGNPADRAIIQRFTENFVANSRAAGYTPSVGWANHTYSSDRWYMGGNTGHYDIAVGHSIGSNRGTYWGGSGETADVAPPSWLATTMNN